MRSNRPITSLTQARSSRRRFGVAAILLGLTAPTAAADAAASISPVVPCSQLAGMIIPASVIRLATGGARVATAVPVPATGQPGTPDYLSEYCEVRGTIAPADPAAPVITFGIALPAQWNHKAIQIGGNGLLGFVPWLAALNRNGAGSPQGASAPPDVPYPLGQGYVTFGDDSGHQAGPPPGRPGGVPAGTGQATMGGPPPMGNFAWVANREAWLNFSYEHIRKGHDAAMAVVRRAYGASPATTYFMGESHGGREALEAIGRYPDDYDGALASVPLTYLTELWIRDLRNVQALAKPGAYVPPSKLPAIEREVVRQCDALDGRVDGVVANYMACNARFDPAHNPHAIDLLRCAGGADTGDSCLSDAQLTAVNTLRSATPLPYAVPGLGKDFPGSPAGSEAANLWLNGRGPPRADDFNPAVSIMRTTLGDAQLTALNFDPARFIPALKRMSDELDAPTDLSRFFARGGKLIYHSAANDYLTNARGHIAAYQAIIARSGPNAARSIRFYVTPGGDHASRSFSFPDKIAQPRQMDLVGTLEAWVERGEAPPAAMTQRLQVLLPPFAVTAARPLCQFPDYPGWTPARQAGSDGRLDCVAPR